MRNPAAPAQAGDCERIGVWSNGYHTSLAVQAEAFAPDHPVRKLYPDAQHFLIGYGARDYYMDEDPGFWAGLGAVLPPTPAAMHIIAADVPVEQIWRPRTMTPVSLSRAGMARLADSIAEAMVLDDQGQAQIIAPGQVDGASVFVRADKGFHLFHMCNQWTAWRLAEAGAPVRPNVSFFAGGLTEALQSYADESPDCRVS